MVRRTLVAGTILFLIGVNAMADEARYVALPEQALVAYLKAINEAKSTIDIATFIYEPCDPSVRVLTDALLAKARAGVHIRILLDGFQQPFFRRPYLEGDFAAAGIEVRYYSDWPFTIDYRMHAKFMVIDGRQMIAGGRNWQDQYFALSTFLNYVDRDVWTVGSSAAAGSAGFQRLWNSDMVSAPSVSGGTRVDWSSYCHSDLKSAKAHIRSFLKKNISSILQSMPARTCTAKMALDDPDFFKSNFGPDWNKGDGAKGFLTRDRLRLKRATTAMLKFLAATTNQLQVENYLYIPITALEQAFARLRSRKVNIEVISNQDIEPEAPDFFVQAEEYEQVKRKEMDEGQYQKVALVASSGALSSAFQLTPVAPTYIHSKVVVRDMRDVIVGSFNMDSRSENINVESMILLTGCPDFADDVLGHFGKVRTQHEQDERSPNPPPKPQFSEFAKALGDMLLPQF